MRRLTEELAADLAALFPSRDATSVLLAAALLVQVAYWYLGAPGPATPRDPAQALRSVLWAVLLLGAVPLLLTRPLRLDLAKLGLGAGDTAAGKTALMLGVAVVLPLAYIAAGDPAVRAVYPWPGTWAGESPLAFLSWGALYALYYLAYEFFYRGFLLRGLEPRLGRYGALWLQTATSTLLHLGKPLVETMAAIPAGLIFGLVALRTRSVLYVFVIHLALGLATDLFSLIRSGTTG